MNPAKYSVLTSCQNLCSDYKLIGEYLEGGIKLLLFSDSVKCKELKEMYPQFISSRLLQVFCPSEGYPFVTVCDGIMDVDQQGAVMALGALAPDFNCEQYLIEHCLPDENMIVEAGAGTGKTTVMIDRIMFLLHVVPDLMPEDIGMITFTNEATQHMKEKIQQELVRRYKATKLSKYVLMLERSSSIRIQTIDSFSKDFISEFGTCVGYGNDVKVRGFIYDKRLIIRSVLNELYSGKKGSVQSVLGLKLRDLEEIIYDFWERFGQAGLSDDSVSVLDWGAAADAGSDALQETFKTVFNRIIEKYNILKRNTDSISVNDIVRELDRILGSGTELVQKSHRLRFLFVDEFQDSDNAQIRSIAWLQKNCGLKLFVVGDIKQSIYRFRGAVDTAFKKLEDDISDFKSFSLVRNYRTSADILGKLDDVFKSWEKRNLFDYGVTLQAQKKHPGIYHTKKILKKNSVIEKETVALVRDCIKDCASVAEKNGTENDNTQRVTVLARTNFQLRKIDEWCKKESIPCYLQTEGTFFRSQAVLDFFALIKAFTFPADVSSLVDYAVSPYSGIAFSPLVLQKYQPGSEAQIKAIYNELDQGGWSFWLKKFRLRPVLAVIDEIINDAKPATRFAEIRKTVLASAQTWTEGDLEAQLNAEILQYAANIDKLLTILRSHYSGQMADLYQIYSYLKLNIATNHNEDEPDISKSVGINCLYGLTVHKAKGLEYDTVIIPFTYRVYRRDIGTEILLDETKQPCRVGWSSVEWADQYHTEAEAQKLNNYYAECVQKEFGDVDREEARLLYVAMTRSIRRLECFVIDPKPHTWADLLE